MKINVCIEATSIEEYLEAIQALAKGYVVDSAPVVNNDTIHPVEVPAEKVDSDVQESKPVETEVKYISTKSAKRLDDKLKGLDDETLESLFAEYNIASVVGLPESDLRKFDAALNKALKEVEADKPIADVADVPSDDIRESTEPKHGFPAVKLIASKLNKIQDGKAEVKFLLDKFGVKKLSDLKEENYDEFHELASKAIADHDKATPISEAHEKDVAETPNEAGEQKEITLEMIRGVAKQLNDQGFKEEIRKALKKFGEPNLGKLKKEDYDEFHKELMKHNG